MVFVGLFLALFVWSHVVFAEDREPRIPDPSADTAQAAASSKDEAQKKSPRQAETSLASGRREAGKRYIDAAELAQGDGHFLLAETIYRKGIDLLQQTAVAHDLELTRGLDDMGWMYVTWGKLLHGSRLISEASATAEGAPPDDPRLIRHLDVQAAYAVVVGRYSLAERCWKKALAVKEARFGPGSPIYAEILLHFGQGSAAFGDYSAAEGLLQNYLQIATEDQRKALSNRVAAQAELGHICLLQHRFSEAKSWFDEASATVRKQTETEPLIRSIVLSYSGDLYMVTRQWENARERYLQALELQQSVLGENRAVAQSMLSLSKALEKLHLKNDARNLMAQAKAILAKDAKPLQGSTIDVLAFRRQ